MRTLNHTSQLLSLSVAANTRPGFPTERLSTGISEVIYHESQCMMALLLLLPLLRQLGLQSRWQLWFTPRQKLNRAWVQSAGLPLSKVMQISQLSPCRTLESMARALRTGNYSVVIGWSSDELTENAYVRLIESAREGNAIGFIMRSLHVTRQLSGLKIHANLYH